jgi:hypothetical protein
MAKVIFSVGVEHPLYNVVVNANIITTNCGYNHNCVIAETIEGVYYPSNPKGLLVFNSNGELVGYRERKPFSEKWRGYVEKIIEK